MEKIDLKTTPTNSGLPSMVAGRMVAARKGFDFTRLLVLRDPELITVELASAKDRRKPAPVESDEDRGSPLILEHVRQHNDKNETAAILTALESTRWNRKQAAELLKIDYKALLYRMKKLNIGN